MGSLGSIFGGSKKAVQTVQQASPQVDQEPAPGDTKKQRIRALLLGTATPEGVLDKATTGRRKLLGN